MKHIFRCLIFFVTIFTLITPAFAVDAPIPAHSDNMKWFCLSAPAEQANSTSHTARLYIKEGTPYEEGKDTTVVVRIAFDHGVKDALELTGDNDSGMTTGNPDLDIKILGGRKGFDDLTNDPQVLMRNAGIIDGTNPTKTFPVTWKDDLTGTSGEIQDRAHYWYGVQEGVITADVAAGAGGGNQFGTFTFSNAGGAKDCAVIRWDPFGYVFDAQTHGPVEGVYVRILTSKTANGVYTPVPVGVGAGKVAQNPIATKKDGSYRYYVDPGYYKLELLGDVSKSGKTYTIERNFANIKPGYEQFGYEQVYIAEKPEPILETAGKVERRDIAIETVGAPAPFSTEGPRIKDILINRSVKNGDQAVRITGMVALIPVDFTAVYKDINGSVISEEKYSLVHGHKYVPEGLHDERNFDIWMGAESKDGKGTLREIKVSSKYSSKVVSLTVPPMPSYLEGIAKNKSGAQIIGGTVAIYPVGGSKPSYKTTTDDKGHFVVATEWVPPFPYELRYMSATGDEIKVSTADYLKQNAVYHKENSIDSFSIVPAKSDPNVTPGKETNNKPNRGSSSINTNNSRSSSLQTTESQTGGIAASGMRGVIVVVVALIILIIVGVGAFIMLKPKQQQPTHPL